MMHPLLSLASAAAIAFGGSDSATVGPVFDDEGHYIAYIYTDGKRDLYTYDSSWRLVLFQGRDGTIASFTYNADGTARAVRASKKSQ